MFLSGKPFKRWRYGRIEGGGVFKIYKDSIIIIKDDTIKKDLVANYKGLSYKTCKSDVFGRAKHEALRRIFI